MLTPQETRELFVTMRRLADGGHSIIFITHKLQEVLAAADRISVMPQGRVVATIDDEGVTAHEIARLMVGRRVLLRVAKAQARPDEKPTLGIKGLTALGDRGDSHCLALALARPPAGGQLCVLRSLCLGKTPRPPKSPTTFFRSSLCLRASVVILSSLRLCVSAVKERLLLAVIICADVLLTRAPST